jgi:quercetin dioxygenase-like cupin family protein
MIAINTDHPYKALDPGVERKILAAGGTMMTAQFRFQKGAIGALHSHPHEQVGYVVSGSIELTLERKTQTLRAGDSYYVPSGLVHGVRALEDTILVDVFTPQREDFL